MNRELPELLAVRLREPLPDPRIDTRFQPRPAHWRHYDAPPADARQAAVLVLLYPRDEQWYVPLTLRPSHLPDHAGQVSLPGGALEDDETSCAAAVREFHEELGADGLPLRMLGQLTPLYVQASNFVVTPWVASTEIQPHWRPSPMEVAELLEVPLAHLLDPACLGSHRRSYRGEVYTAPHFVWQSHQIWGATCLVLGELVHLVEVVVGKRNAESG